MLRRLWPFWVLNLIWLIKNKTKTEINGEKRKTNYYYSFWLTYYSECYTVRKILFIWFKLTDVHSLCFHTGDSHLNCEVGARVWKWETVVIAKHDVVSIKSYQSPGFNFWISDNLPFPLGSDDLALPQITTVQVHIFSQDSCDVVCDLNNLLFSWTKRTTQWSVIMKGQRFTWTVQKLQTWAKQNCLLGEGCDCSCSWEDAQEADGCPLLCVCKWFLHIPLSFTS